MRVELNRTHVLAVAVSKAAPHVAETTRLILNRARVLTPVDTGNLRGSLQSSMRARRTSVTGTVQTRVRYALVVHQGSRAHYIRPKTKRALAFYWKRKAVYVVRKWVYHPGTKARPFLMDAVVEVGTSRGYRTIHALGAAATPGPG